MRVADRPLPPILLDPAAFAGRPVRPVVAVQGVRDVAPWDDTPLEIWDDPLLEWDQDLVPGFVDATCSLQGLEIESGNPDDHMTFDTGHAVVQLDNRAGRWSKYATNGTQQVHGPGMELAVWAHDTDGTDSWLFRGVITRWDDFTDTVVVEAFDTSATLAQPVATFTAGTNGQTPAPRLAAIMAVAGRAALTTRFATGDVTLTAQPSTQSPLEEMQTVAASDGGAMFCDADGAMVYMRRNWRAGRTDQTVLPVASDNVCTAETVVWDAVLSNNDDGLADTVIFENVAKLRGVSPAGAPTGFVFTETGHQWTTQTEGDTLAAWVYAAQHDRTVSVDEFTLHVFDPKQPALYKAPGWRLLDLLRFLHDNHAIDGTIRIDFNALITTITHDVTPDSWQMTVKTGKATQFNTNLVWNPAGDPYVWDTPNYVWGYQ